MEANSLEAPQAKGCGGEACRATPAAASEAEAVAVAVVEAALAIALEATSRAVLPAPAPAQVPATTAKEAPEEATKEQLATVRERAETLESEGKRSGDNASQVDSAPALTRAEPTAVNTRAVDRGPSAAKLTPWQIALSAWLRRVTHAASVFFTLLQMEATSNRRLKLNAWPQQLAPSPPL